MSLASNSAMPTFRSLVLFCSLTRPIKLGYQIPIRFLLLFSNLLEPLLSITLPFGHVGGYFCSTCTSTGARFWVLGGCFQICCCISFSSLCGDQWDPTDPNRFLPAGGWVGYLPLPTPLLPLHPVVRADLLVGLSLAPCLLVSLPVCQPFELSA